MYAECFGVFLLNSAKCRVHYKYCSWESSVLLLSVFCHSRKLWLWQAHSTHQWRMVMLCATHLSRTRDKLCFCFSFGRINHCSHASIVLNLWTSCDTGYILGSKVTISVSSGIVSKRGTFSAFPMLLSSAYRQHLCDEAQPNGSTAELLTHWHLHRLL